MSHTNGVNGVDHEQGPDHDMANGDDGAAPDGGAVGAGLQGERQPNKVRVTTPYLTKYERARILGTRALQIRCVHWPWGVRQYLIANVV